MPEPTPLTLADPADEPPLPMQFTLAGGAHTRTEAFDHRRPSIAFAALWLGAALHPFAQSKGSGLFLGPGLEGTVDGATGLYQWSIGTGLRIGHVWRSTGTSLPDTYVYTRVTPFLGMRTIAGDAYLDEIGSEDGSLSRTGAGVRLGVGVVSPAWTRFLWGNAFESGIGDIDAPDVSSPEEAIVCCVVGAVVLLANSLELTAEVYDEEGPQEAVVRLGVRAGVGF